ncbi:MAG TPA: hypothetical protein VGJ33_18625 [Candidatus Angelobacter sp.]
MTRQTYKQAYETAKTDLVEHLKKRARLEGEIRKLRDSVKALGELCGAEPDEVAKLLLSEGFTADSRLGFTDAIRRLFQMNKSPLHPTEIRENLLKIGIGREQVNLLSSIHTVLRRMAEAGEIQKTDGARFRAVSRSLNFQACFPRS